MFVYIFNNIYNNFANFIIKQVANLSVTTIFLYVIGIVSVIIELIILKFKDLKCS